VIDKGLSINETKELLALNAAYVDFIKLTFGTTTLYNREILAEKILIAEDYGVPVYPGGTLFEIALCQQKSQPYFEKLAELGFKWIEISDGTLTISVADRVKAIREALECGLKVITEAGKKDSLRQPGEEVIIDTALNDLETGASWVIIEARESGQGIGIYDAKGNIIADKLGILSAKLPMNKIIWEAPLKNQQAKLINDFGPNVNLGNIPPTEVMALEALRLGYRSDTWKV
jgi:Uncharacterized conserved protein